MRIIADTNIPFVEECFSSLGEVRLAAGREITNEMVRDADILLVRSVTPVNEQLLKGSKVSFVATATIGVDHIDTEYLSRSGISFASAPGSNANSVAEYVVAALLDIANKKGFALNEKSIGIIGAGNVGKLTAAKCRALGMEVLLNDPPLKRQTDSSEYLSIEELYDCDIITLHTPLNLEGPDRTFHLASRKFFSSLKKQTIFINTSRGAVHETDALKTAIAEGRLSEAVLDVWENEPIIDTQLLEMTTLATPHIAGYSFDGKVAGMMMVYKAACEYFDHRPQCDITSLGKAQPAEIELSGDYTSNTQILDHCVKKLYDITMDDKNMRQILKLDPAERGRFFDSLRKNYPLRREFQNTTVKLPGTSGVLKNILNGIGFKVSM